MLTTVIAAFAFCFVLERIVPGWPLPQVRTWPRRALLVHGIQPGVILLAGISWERWLALPSVFHLSQHVSPAVGKRWGQVLQCHIALCLHAYRTRVDVFVQDMTPMPMPESS